MPQAPTWDQSEEAPSWADSEDLPSWEDSTEESSKPPIPEFIGKPEVLVEGRTVERLPASFIPEPDLSGKPVVNVEGRTMESLPASLEPGPDPFDPTTPLINPDVIRAAVDIGTATLPRDEFTEGVRRGVTGLAAGMTSPESIAMTPAFAIPVVGPALAMGLGAKSVGAGLGRVVAGVESGDAGEVGEGATETVGGGLMAVAGGKGAISRPMIPPRIVEAMAKADAVGLPKSAQAVADTVKREQPIEIQAKVQPISDRPQQLETPIEKGIPDAIRESPATEGVLRQERPEVELQGVREPQVETAIAREPARGQGGEEGQVLLTGPEVIKSIVELPDAEAGALRQKPAVEAGLKLTEADVPALEAARDKAGADMLAELEAGNDVAFKAQYGKNIWFSGAIEGARRKGPNYDTFIKEQQAAAPTAPEAQPAGFAGQQPVGQRAVGAAEVAATAAETVTVYRGEGKPYSKGKLASLPEHIRNYAGEWFTTNPKDAQNYADSYGGSVRTMQVPKSELEQFRIAETEEFRLPKDVQSKYSQPAGARVEPFFERESEVGKPAEVGPGMGGAKASEPVDPRAQLAQLTDSIATLAKEGKSAPAKAFDLGRALSQAKETVTSTLDGLKAAGQYMKLRLEGKPVATEYRGVLGDRHLALSESSVNARRWMKDVKKAVPDPMVREAISDWVDTGGDPALLTKAASETKPQYKAGYERAQKLTPEEKVVAENLKNYFDSRLQEAIDAGVLEDGIENYIHRAYEAESPWKKGVIQELRSGLFTGNPALAKKRIFEYDFEAEKLGKKPVKDFAQRVGAYDLALNKSIADRAAVKAMMEIKMSDGRPMIDVGGGGKVIEGPTGEAILINRSEKKIDPNDPKADRGDFKPFDHPALRKWKWAAEDTAGKPIFVQGDVLIHPEAIGDIRKLLEPSAIRRNPIGRAALGVSSTVKQTMLDLSLFHQVQIGVHALEHRTFGPVKEIDFTNPDVRGLVRGGAVVGETSGAQAFSEGLHGSSLTKHIPWAGERISAYKDYLFSDFIPRIKVAMGLHALERNRSRFKNLSQDELYQLTANQMNAAFGELNYEMMGRSKTMQDALRLGLLAPDFLEARGRFAAQAGTVYGGLPHFREGKFTIGEQGNALLLGAATMYIFARMANKFINDEYHFETKNAFNVIYKGKSYGLRTVQGDLIHAATDPGKFVNHRLNPVYGKPALEFATGRDYFGRKRDAGQKLQDLAMTPIPIAARGMLSGQEQTLLESFLNSIGAVVKRDSPSSDMAVLAANWKKENKIATGPGEFIYDAEKDPYRPIKLAAERDDEAGARSEIAKAINEGMKRSQIIQHFKLSEKHRFAGSAANERKFLESLTEDQKKIYQDAKTERKRIRELVMRALP